MAFELRQRLEQRRALVSEDTDAYRVLDGTEWAGVFIDSLADRLLVSLRDTGLPRGLGVQLRDMGRPVYLKRLDKDNKQAPELFCGRAASPRFVIRENGVRYLMDMEAGYSQGLFLDQRLNRAKVRHLCKPGMRVLNTFAYTGAFSVCAALGGAVTTTLDLAQPCLSWCRQNMALNNLEPEDHFFCKGDTLHWLERFARQGRVFDGIILDPPTFSRDAKGYVWRVEQDYARLVEKAVSCLAPEGWLLCCTNCRKLSHADFRKMVCAGFQSAQLKASPMPPDFDGEDYLKCLWVWR